MKTPICDYVRAYAEKQMLRLHIPGHKGTGFLGMEHLDITEIDGADSLYEADGIIAQSEANAGRLFGCSTFYSTEGSSQCIRAMLHLAVLHGRKNGRRPVIAAARNVHKTFLSAAALLDLEVLWLYPERQESYLSCCLTPAALERQLSGAGKKPAAVYLTSPDYLGHQADIAGLAAVCHDHGTLLLVDNAHGAYLRFLPESLFPVDLGADICCSSAHKTLPVLTGGAYLHLSGAVEELAAYAKNALALFGSTSPSYLILQSLDLANPYLEEYSRKLGSFLPAADALKRRLREHGFVLCGEELLKVTISAKPFGYEGKELAEYLLAREIVCEFADPDYLVLMLTPETGKRGLVRLEEALLAIDRRPPIQRRPPCFQGAERVMSIREAMLSAAQILPVCQSRGKVLTAASVGCPPAVPILVCGERIDDHAADCFRYYGIERVAVVAE